MLRSYWIAAWRNLLSGGLYSAISIFGLSIGICVAILSCLIVRNEYSYDHFIRGYQDTYLCVSVLTPASHPPVYNTQTNNRLATLLKGRFPRTASVSRIAEDNVSLGRGDIAYPERIYWADPTLFDVLKLPVLFGDVTAALRRPDSIVLTQDAARKYFGHDDAIGEYLQLNRSRPLRVTAVIRDLPVNQSELETGIFVAGVSAYSKLSALDRETAGIRPGRAMAINVNTYFRMVSGQPIEPLRAQIPTLLDSLWPLRPSGLGAAIEPIRIDQLHVFDGLNPGTLSRVAIVSAVGVLVLLVACINFVNLFNARSARRALEVGIRKVNGAGQRDLLLQFVGESVMYILIATCVAAALIELLLPSVDAFLNSGATFDYWRNPALLTVVILGALALGLAAGIYPAFVLAAMRPVDALKGLMARADMGVAARKTLIATQFAVMIGLILGASVIFKQRGYATRQALKQQSDRMVMIRAPCRSVLLDEIGRLAGVRGVSCSGTAFLNEQMFGNLPLRNGTTITVNFVPVGEGLLQLYGFKPLAGDFDFGDDDVTGENGNAQILRVVLNATAVRNLGYSTAQAAIGQYLSLPPLGPGAHQPAKIIGVVQDFTFNVLGQSIKPALYIVKPKLLGLINVRIAGSSVPETLSGIDRVWLKTGTGGAIDRFFLGRYLRDLYAKVLRQGQILAAFSVVTLLVASLGLLGLAAAAAQRRTVEIGIRKAMGASASDILRMLLWQFSIPVLWGSLVAWPISAYFLERWLHGFVYHTDLPLWYFPGATALTLMLALATVSFHAAAIARGRPVAALRYE